ncbi:MAG TPA: peptidase U32 family protein [Sphingobacteriaceae bacterium]|nr:peptidase U32 family protein [Sphingobacteriaceae bacterium]
MAAFELTAEIPTLDQLKATDLTPFDGVYLGQPYCRLYRDNPIANFDQLKAAVAYLKEKGKKAYVSTDAGPRSETLPQVQAMLEICAELEVDGIDVQSLGVLRLAHRDFPQLPLIAGGFINLYTLEGARTLAQYGVRVLRPSYELNLDEINLIRDETGLEVELLVHGKFPLGITDRCFLLDYQEQTGLSCPDICLEEFWMTRGSWTLRHIGTALLSGKQMCMLEHLPHLVGLGYRRFRIGTLTTPAPHRGEMGRIYREALAQAADAQHYPRETLMKELEKYSRHGFCNGYYFGQSGHLYISHAEKAAQSATTI